MIWKGWHNSRNCLVFFIGRVRVPLRLVAMWTWSELLRPVPLVLLVDDSLSNYSGGPSLGHSDRLRALAATEYKKCFFLFGSSNFTLTNRLIKQFQVSLYKFSLDKVDVDKHFVKFLWNRIQISFVQIRTYNPESTLSFK